MTKLLLQALLLPLPWSIRRRALVSLLGYDISPKARIGLSLVCPEHLTMKAGATIGHLNLMRGMEAICLDEGAIISHLNWIYGIPAAQLGGTRRSELHLHEGAGITRRHLIDCSEHVTIGRFALVAGYGTQILTHAIDLREGKQGARPVVIGEYSLVGTRSVVLGGAVLPAFSALGAGSTLRDAPEATHQIYSGVPAKAAASVDPAAAFFARTTARVS